MKIKSFLLIFMLIFLTRINAQHFIGISAKFTQIQEKFNNDMVFEGPTFSLNYSYQNIDSERALIFSPTLGVSILDNRGILGISVDISPINIYYGYRISNNDDYKLYIGPQLKASYSLQLYPDLQSGLDFWTTNFSLAPNLYFEYPSGEDLLTANIAISALNVTSRPPASRDYYFFSLKVSDFISDLHSNMKFGSINRLFDTSFNLNYYLGKSRTWGIGYRLNYLQYFDDPQIKMLNHALNIKYNLGGNK